MNREKSILTRNENSPRQLANRRKILLWIILPLLLLCTSYCSNSDKKIYNKCVATCSDDINRDARCKCIVAFFKCSESCGEDDQCLENCGNDNLACMVKYFFLDGEEILLNIDETTIQNVTSEIMNAEGIEGLKEFEAELGAQGQCLLAVKGK